MHSKFKMIEPSLKAESQRSGPMFGSLKYRPDIDGLRALAVLPVVFFHANWPLFGGGFVGVDIFFVISGFLITSILLNALHSGKFSIKHFYERRIRRILPALYIVCLVSAIVASILFLPSDLENFGKSLVSALFFVSNFLFWQETGYFDTHSDLKPLLHTWSLAVEEQFYIAFPVFLYLIHKFLRQKYAFFIGLVALGSFALSAWALTNFQSATFYLAPTRAWELLMGSLLALGILPAPRSRLLSEALSLIGLTLIGYSIFIFDYATLFPGPSALLPCLGAVLLIYSHTESDTVIKRALSWKPMVGIGLISYSLYLWHWPLLVFGRYVASEPLTYMASTALVVLSFVLSFLSWRYVEKPFRDPKRVVTYPTLARVAVVSSVALIALGGTITIMKGMPDRFIDIERLESYNDQFAFAGASCIDIQSDKLSDKICRFGYADAPTSAFMIWGDSHAHSITPAVTIAAEKHQRAGTLASTSACPPLLGVKDVRSENPDKCPAANNAILAAASAGQVVFLVARWPYYVSRSMVNKEGPAWLVDEETKGISEVENLRVFERGLTRTIKALREKGAYPVLVSSPPEFFRSAPEVFYRFNEIPVTPKALVDSNRSKIEDTLERIAKEHNLTHLKIAEEFCENGHCKAGEGQTLYFRDSHHLTVDGAKKVVDLFVPVFAEKDT